MYKFLVSSLVFAFLTPNVLQASLESRTFCTPFATGEKPFERNYEIYQNKQDLQNYVSQVYQGSRRLHDRAYWDTKEKSLVLPYAGTAIKVPAAFWEGLSKQFSQALKNDYATGVVYPDMGHIHILLPSSSWERIKKSAESKALRIEALLSSPEVQALYHTAEMVQLKVGDFATGTFPQDPWKLWRYFTRNLLGTFHPAAQLEVIWAGEKPKYNTVREIAGMTEVSVLYFIANREGCIPFAAEGTTKYFDMTFSTIPYEATRAPSAKRPTAGPELH